jgi:hypothetical protein
VTGTCPPPVFVVGGPRSGTTLLAAMLGSHSAFDCGPETFFLWRWSRLGARRRAEALDPATWPDGGTHLVCSLTLGKRLVHELYGVAPGDVRRWLAGRAPSPAALLEALTAQRAARHGKPRWVEKTPRHLETAALIRSTWPEARIVRVVRDPRDAAVSLTRVPFGTPSLVTNLSSLARMDEASRAFFAADATTWTIRYEDLVARPEPELRRLCAYLEVEYEPAMVEDRSEAAGVAASHEWWKGDVTGPLDPSRAGVWRQEMPEAVQRYAALNLAGFLSRHGYEGARECLRRVAIVPSGDALNARFDGMLLRLAAADIAIERPVPRSVGALARWRDVVFVGVNGQLDPDRDAPPARRAASILALGGLLAWRRLRGRPVTWVPRLSLVPRRQLDPGERAVTRLLQVLARRVEADTVPALLGAPPHPGSMPGPGATG